MSCFESPAEALTRQFYEWEVRGRGWQVFERPVILEPPFRLFAGHYLASSPAMVDDGRRETIFSSLFKRRRSSAEQDAASEDPESAEPEPEYAVVPERITELAVALPPEIKVSRDAAGQFLMSIGHLSSPAAFEIIGTREEVVVQFACARCDLRQIREQLQAYFPEGSLVEREKYLDSLWDTTGTKETAVVEFGLAKEFMRPLRLFDRFDPDPLAGLIGAMADLGTNDTVLFQTLFTPVRHPWAESILRAVTDATGEPFFEDDPNMVRLATEKISSALFATVIRVAVQSNKSRWAWRTTENMGRSLRQFAAASSNELIPLANDEYDERQHREDVAARHSCRAGLILNCDELVSLVHLPSASVRSAKLKREHKRTKPAPRNAIGHRLVIGTNRHAGKSVEVSLGPEQRVRHMHCIGASGSGKSTLLLSMIVQDLRNGDGLAVLDPHGDLIDRERYVKPIL